LVTSGAFQGIEVSRYGPRCEEATFAPFAVNAFW
jgi:hypothetical protein